MTHMRRHTLAGISLLAFLSFFAERSRAEGFKFLEVTVLDPDGKPMADVPVEMSVDNTRFPMPTDAEGKVAINVPTAENSEVEVRVRHDGYAAMAVAWRSGKEIPPAVTIPLTKGVTFGGIVHDEHGQPVAGVEVSGQMVFEERYGLVHDGKVTPFLDGELAKTDEAGRWKCSMAPEGDAEIQLSFSHPGFLDQYYRSLASWDELKGQGRIAVMEKGIPLTGRLLGPDGKPASQMRLLVMEIEDGGYVAWETITDEQGRFTTRPIRKGPATISVENIEYAPLQESVDVIPGIEPLLLKLDRGRPMEIKVVNVAEEPLMSATVHVTDWLYQNNVLSLGDNYNVDANGIWRWPHAPSDMLTYRISAPGYRDAKHQLLSSDRPQTITLKPAVKITGRVIDKASREPIKKFKLMGIATIDCGVDEKCVIGFGTIDLKTSGDYTFEASLLCEEFRVSCSAEGYNNASSRTIASDEDQVQWDFELEPKTENPRETK
jgi:hypothetical protein